MSGKKNVGYDTIYTLCWSEDVSSENWRLQMEQVKK